MTNESLPIGLGNEPGNGISGKQVEQAQHFGELSRISSAAKEASRTAAAPQNSPPSGTITSRLGERHAEHDGDDCGLGIKPSYESPLWICSTLEENDPSASLVVTC